MRQRHRGRAAAGPGHRRRAAAGQRRGLRRGARGRPRPRCGSTSPCARPPACGCSPTCRGSARSCSPPSQAYARDISIDTDRIESALQSVDPTRPGRHAVSAAGPAVHAPSRPGPAGRAEPARDLPGPGRGLGRRRRRPRHRARTCRTARRSGEAVRRRRAAGGPAEQTFAALVGLELRPRRLRDAANLWAALRGQRRRGGRDGGLGATPTWRRPRRTSTTRWATSSGSATRRGDGADIGRRARRVLREGESGGGPRDGPTAASASAAPATTSPSTGRHPGRAACRRRYDGCARGPGTLTSWAAPDAGPGGAAARLPGPPGRPPRRHVEAGAAGAPHRQRAGARRRPATTCCSPCTARPALWFQFGGHYEPGDADVPAAATREAREESGIAGLRRRARARSQLDRHALVGGLRPLPGASGPAVRRGGARGRRARGQRGVAGRAVVAGASAARDGWRGPPAAGRGRAPAPRARLTAAARAPRPAAERLGGPARPGRLSSRSAAAAGPRRRRPAAPPRLRRAARAPPQRPPPRGSRGPARCVGSSRAAPRSHGRGWAAAGARSSCMIT